MLNQYSYYCPKNNVKKFDDFSTTANNYSNLYLNSVTNTHPNQVVIEC
jgi:hypothetical protein